MTQGASFCSHCGAAQDPAGARAAAGSAGGGVPPPMPPGPQMSSEPAPGYASYQTARTEGTAIASLVLGIAGLFICPIVCSILAVVFGKQAKGKIAADRSLQGEGLAKAGVVLGWIGVAISILWILLAVRWFSGGDAGLHELPGFQVPG